MEEVLHLLLQELGCAMGDDAVTLLSALQSLDLLSIFFAANLALFMPCYAFSFCCGVFAGECPSLRIANHLPSHDLSQARDIKVDMPDPGTHEWQWEDAYLTL